MNRGDVGNAVLAQLLSVAAELGVARVFCLTFEIDFFTRNGFEVLEGTPVEPEGVCAVAAF